MTRKIIKSDNEKWWYGVPGIRMIWHGEWNDPELECDGYVANYWDVENTMYEYAKEDGIDADNDDDAFAQYVRDHADDAKYLVTECGTKEEDDFIDSGCHGKTKKKTKKPVKSSMSVKELPREALQELKQRYYAEKYDKDLSYGELADIDDIVSDEEVFDEYGGTSFTEDDFFCLANSRKPVKSSMPGKEKGIQAIMDEYGCTREEAIEIMNEEIQNSRKPVKSSNEFNNEVADLQIDMTNTGYFEDGWLLLNVVGDGKYNVNGRPDDTEFTINAYGPNGEDLGSKKFDFLELWYRGSINSSRKAIKSSLVNGISDEELKLLCGYADRAFEDIDWLYDSDPNTLAEHDYDQTELRNAQKIAQRLYNMLSEGI